MESWGNPPILRTGLDTAWRILEGHALKKEQIIQTIEASKKIIPDNEQFTSLFTDAALNAVASMIYTLQCGVEEDIKFAIYSGQAAIQTIETYLINVNIPTLGIQLYDESLNEWIQQAPLLLAEINIQKKTVELLQSQSILEKSFLNKLKNSAKDVGIFPLQRGLLVREV